MAFGRDGQGQGAAPGLLSSSVFPQVFQTGFICRHKACERLHLNAAWPEQSAATAGTKQNRHSRAVI